MITRNEFKRMTREIMDKAQATYSEKLDMIADLYETASQLRTKFNELPGDDTFNVD